jgi:hypothetical protein
LDCKYSAILKISQHLPHFFAEKSQKTKSCLITNALLYQNTAATQEELAADRLKF